MADKEELGPNHIKNYELGEMQPYGNYPQSLLDTFKNKALLGPRAHLKTEDAHAGLLEIAPGTDYAAHTHAWPEAYFIIKGTADCQWGDDSFVCGPGTMIYGEPFTSHAMQITSEEPLLALIFSWAPGGDRSVYDEDGKLI